MGLLFGPIPLQGGRSPDPVLENGPDVVEERHARLAGFVEGSLINFNYETIAETAYISPTALQAPVPGNFPSGGSVPVVVYNPGIEVSHEAFLDVINPVPVLDAMVPTRVTGGYGGTLNISGSNFVDTSIGRLNGQDVGSGIHWPGSGYISVPIDRVANSGSFSVTVFNPPPGGGTSNALTLTVTGYSLDVSPHSVTTQVGKGAVYTIQVTPQLGPFNARIKFSCGDLPRGCKASFNPEGLTPGESPGTTTLLLTTKPDSGSASGALAGTSPLGPLICGLFFLVPALCLRLFARRSTAPTPWGRWILAGLVVCLFLTVSACGSGSSENPAGNGTPKGTYRIPI